MSSSYYIYIGPMIRVKTEKISIAGRRGDTERYPLPREIIPVLENGTTLCHNDTDQPVAGVYYLMPYDAANWGAIISVTSADGFHTLRPQVMSTTSKFMGEYDGELAMIRLMPGVKECQVVYGAYSYYT